MRVNKARHCTHEEKNKIDEYHLELLNLLYEVTHLQKEINKCLEFRSLHEGIELVDIDEFYAKAPADITKKEEEVEEEEESVREHKLKLARLDWELMERQNMLGQIKELESQINIHEASIKSKKSKLQLLHPKLNQIIDSSKPTLEYFNTKFSDECSFSEIVQHLPKPLYQLYMMINAHREISDRDIDIQVSGDLDEAKNFNLNDKIQIDEADADTDSDNEDTELAENRNNKKSSKSKHKKSKSSSNRDKLFNCYPLSVKIGFTLKGYGQLTIEFFYLTILKIITVKFEMNFSDDQLNFNPNIDSILNEQQMFSYLLANDNGLESPNLSNKFLFNYFGIKSFEPYLNTYGTPYRWSQMLCGLFFENKFDRHTLVSNQKQKDESNLDDTQDNVSIISNIGDNNDDNDDDDTKKSSPNKKSKNNDDIEMKDDNDDKEANESDNEGDDSIDGLADNSMNEVKIFEEIIKRLKNRFKVRVRLQRTLQMLGN
jgi:THO complex subunit 5